MSHDFQRGLLPAGATPLPPNEYGFSSLPYQPAINHTAASVPSFTKAIQIPGGDDPRKVPPLIAAVFFASGWQFNISLSGPGGISHAWTGSVNRGIFKDINDAGTTEAGIALTSIKQAWSAGLYPEFGGQVGYPEQDARYEESLTSTPPESLLTFLLNPYYVTFYAIPNQWVFAPSFFAGINDGTIGGDQATVSSIGSGDATSGLSVCGVEFELFGNDVVSFSGTITPSGWLE